jgi:RNA polymerase sigma-70 factor (ECF subfamily)
MEAPDTLLRTSDSRRGTDETPPSRREDLDARIFARFMAGDDSALLELFDRHHHRIFLYCLKIVGNREQAEDLTQELWERVIRYREQPRDVQKPVTLMLTIARNLCLNYLKVSRRYSSLEDLPESAHPTMTTRELSHMEELVALSLPKLPFEQREVLVLHSYCGYRFEEIAELLNEPAGTLRMRASRARSHLGRIISAMIGLEEDREKSRGLDNDLNEPEQLS